MALNKHSPKLTNNQKSNEIFSLIASRNPHADSSMNEKILLPN